MYATIVGNKSSFANAYQRAWSWRGFRQLLMYNGFICIAGPRFFEFHWKLDRFVSHLPFGILGIVAARKKAEI
jgi:hypothetical protein